MPEQFYGGRPVGDVVYSVSHNPNRGNDSWSVMRNSIVIARYGDMDVAYEVLELLQRRQIHEA